MVRGSNELPVLTNVTDAPEPTAVLSTRDAWCLHSDLIQNTLLSLVPIHLKLSKSLAKVTWIWFRVQLLKWHKAVNATLLNLDVYIPHTGVSQVSLH